MQETKLKPERCERVCCSTADGGKLFEQQSLEIDLQTLGEFCAVPEEFHKAGYTDARISTEIIKSGGQEYRFYETDLEINDSLMAYEEDCLESYLTEEAGSVLTAYVMALGRCYSFTLPYVQVLCAGYCTVSCSIAMIKIMDLHENGVELCEEKYGEGGSSEDDVYCETGSDCDSDEWCDKGMVLGIGVNECKPKKAEGKACYSDGECQSDCCGSPLALLGVS